MGHPKHAGIARKHLPDQVRDSDLARPFGEVLQQQGSDPPAVLGVIDEDRELGGGRIGGTPLSGPPARLSSAATVAWSTAAGLTNRSTSAS
jgi:hypothetical protein